MKTISVFWFVLAAGLALIAMGVCIYIYPWRAYSYLIHFTGIMLLLNSFLLVTLYYCNQVKQMRARWFFLLESALDIFLGALLLFSPLFTIILFPLLFGIWAISKGILKAIILLLNKNNLPNQHLLVIDCTAMILSGSIIISYPFENASNIAVISSIFVLLIGIFNTLKILKYRKTHFHDLTVFF